VLPDNDTGINMTPLDEREQNTQSGAGRAAMLATRPAVQIGGYSRSPSAVLPAPAGSHGGNGGCYRLKKAAARRAISSAVTSSMGWLIIHCWPNGSRSRPPRSP
jgi:hypothetical protein